MGCQVRTRVRRYADTQVDKVSRVFDARRKSMTEMRGRPTSSFHAFFLARSRQSAWLVRFVEPKGIGIGINRTEGMRETENNEFDKKKKKKTPKREKERRREEV